MPAAERFESFRSNTASHQSLEVSARSMTRREAAILVSPFKSSRTRPPSVARFRDSPFTPTTRTRGCRVGISTSPHRCWPTVSKWKATRQRDAGAPRFMGSFDLQLWTPIGAMNWSPDWERRHPCRRVSGSTSRRRAGRDAGAPSSGPWKVSTSNFGRALQPSTEASGRQTQVSAQRLGGHRVPANLPALCPPNLCAQSCSSWVPRPAKVQVPAFDPWRPLLIHQCGRSSL